MDNIHTTYTPQCIYICGIKYIKKGWSIPKRFVCSLSPTPITRSLYSLLWHYDHATCCSIQAFVFVICIIPVIKYFKYSGNYPLRHWLKLESFMMIKHLSHYHCWLIQANRALEFRLDPIWTSMFTSSSSSTPSSLSSRACEFYDFKHNFLWV